MVMLTAARCHPAGEDRATARMMPATTVFGSRTAGIDGSRARVTVLPRCLPRAVLTPRPGAAGAVLGAHRAGGRSVLAGGGHSCRGVRRAAAWAARGGSHPGRGAGRGAPAGPSHRSRACGVVAPPPQRLGKAGNRGVPRHTAPCLPAAVAHRSVRVADGLHRNRAGGGVAPGRVHRVRGRVEACAVRGALCPVRGGAPSPTSVLARQG
jgi:hypothetical protein